MKDPVLLDPARYRRVKRRRSFFGTFFLMLMLLIGAVVLVRVVQAAVGSSAGPLFGDAVGVVRIEGAINDSRKVAEILKSMRDSSRIKAVVLRLDTPGGSVGASEEIYREVLRLREEKKPVVASMGNAAASGGYYIAAGADEIFANAGTITGSIGVIAPGFNAQGALHKLGLRSTPVKSGEHKDTGSPFDEMTEEERNLLQHLIANAYEQFFRVVLKGRHEAIARVLKERPQQFEDVVASARTKRAGAGLEWEAFTTGTVAAQVGAAVEAETALRRVADGRVITGEQGLAVGLVDRIGGQEEAVERAAELAGIEGEPSVVEREPKSDMPAWLGAAARQALDAFSGESLRIEYR